MAGSVAAGEMIVGSTDTLLVGGTNIIPQVATDLIKYDDRSRPIFSIMSKMGMIEDARNSLYQWQEIQLDEPSVNNETAINAGIAGSTFDANVDSLAIVPGDQFLDANTNQLFETVQVYCQDGATGGGHTAAAGTSWAQFKKRPAASAISAMTANGMWFRMPNTMLEGGAYRDPLTKLPKRLSNTIAMFNTSVSVSEYSDYVSTYYGRPWDLNLEQVHRQLNHDLERAIIFGKSFEEASTIARSSVSNDTGVARGTQGVWDSIQTKRVQYNTAVTEAGLDSFLGVLFGDPYGGGDSKYLFSGPQPYADIAGFVKNKFRQTNTTGDINYGLRIQEYVSPIGSGSAFFVEERQFFDTNPVLKNNPYRQSMIALDPAYFRLMKVGPSLIKIKNTTPPGLSRKSLSIETWVGVKLMAERFHGIYSPILT